MQENLTLGGIQPKKLRYVYFLKRWKKRVDGGYFPKTKSWDEKKKICMTCYQRDL